MKTLTSISPESPLHCRGLKTGSTAPAARGRPQPPAHTGASVAGGGAPGSHHRPRQCPPPRSPKLPSFPGGLHPSLAQRLPQVGWGGLGRCRGQVCHPLTEDSGKGFFQLPQTRESGFRVREHIFHHFYLLRQDSEPGLLRRPGGGSVCSNQSQAPSHLAGPTERAPRTPWLHLQVGALRHGALCSLASAT